MFGIANFRVLFFLDSEKGFMEWKSKVWDWENSFSGLEKNDFLFWKTVSPVVEIPFSGFPGLENVFPGLGK